MIPSARIGRGFHRIGVVLALPVLLLAGSLAGHEAWLQWTTNDPYAGFADAPPASKTSNPFDRFDLPSDAKPTSVAPYYRADYTLASLALVLSFALYAAARAVGWVLTGFIGSDNDVP